MVYLLERGFFRLGNQLGLHVDQVRYTSMFILSYPLALLLHYGLHPSHTSTLLRCFFSMTSGLFIVLVCFGWNQASILFGFVAISYLLILCVPSTLVQRYSMVWSFGCLFVYHLHHVLTNYQHVHSWDFSGPLMIMVQKITYVAYALHDGQARQFDLSKDQEEQKIDSIPSIIKYFSYMFNFTTILAGPSCTFREHLEFMDGSNFTKHGETKNEPSMLMPTLRKLAGSVLSVTIYLVLEDYIRNKTILDPHHWLPYRLFLNSVNTLRLRSMYYFVWQLSDSISNCAGLGFSGYDNKGQPKWDLVCSLNILDVEFGTSLRTCFGGWNILTNQWLRRCVFERTPMLPTLTTLTVSALWHGFYPGYYFCLFHFAFSIFAARKMRRLLRGYFQEKPGLTISYDIVTWLVVIIFRDAGIAPHSLKYLDKSILYWSYYYYIPSALAIIIVILPWGTKSKRNRDPTEDTRKEKEY